MSEIDKTSAKMKKVLLSGNEAIAEGAICAGCRFYAGYPITPQNELTAYMAKHMPEAEGKFIQAESELAAINMVLGAAAAGERAMTSSSSPGISLKQEGISYLAGTELPAVIVNIMRGGPGLGNIAPSQSDYFQATKGGGHGDYHCIVLAPSTVQEAFDFMAKAFDLADKYRNPVLILGDGLLGQMMEPLIIKSKISVNAGFTSGGKNQKSKINKPWALTGCRGRNPNIIRSLYLAEGALEKLNMVLQKKYTLIKQREQQYESKLLDDATIVLVAYGMMARLANSTINILRKKGVRIGLLRPISLWPFPEKIFQELLKRDGDRIFFTVEMSYGQMLEDVRLVVNGKAPVEFLGRAGGGIPTEEEIVKAVTKISH
jgi:2-oxoglutarate ferredoxin oxidoreductase subunit alpha